MTILTVPEAPYLPPIPVEITVPTLNVTIPEAHIAWAYEAYTNVLLSVIEAQLEGVPAELDKVWGLWEGEQERIWGNSFDLVSAMGYANVLVPYKTKTENYVRLIYAKAKSVLGEAVRTRNLKLYLSTRLDIERQRQSQYADQKALELRHAKALIDAVVVGYETARLAFMAQVAEAEAQQKKINVELEKNDLVLKLYEQLIEVEKTKVDANRNLVAAKQAEVRKQQALYEVADALMEVQRVSLKVDAAELEVARTQIQTLIKGSELILEQAQQADITADIALIGAQADELRVYSSDLMESARQLAIVQETAAEKINAYNEIVAQKEQIFGELTAAEQHKLDAEKDYVAAQVSAAEAGIQVEEIEGEARVALIEANGQADLLNIQAGDEVARADDDLSVLAEVLNASVENARYLAQTDIAEAKSKVAGILKNAKIVNVFNEITG